MKTKFLTLMLMMTLTGMAQETKTEEKQPTREERVTKRANMLAKQMKLDEAKTAEFRDIYVRHAENQTKYREELKGVLTPEQMRRMNMKQGQRRAPQQMMYRHQPYRRVGHGPQHMRGYQHGPQRMMAYQGRPGYRGPQGMHRQRPQMNGREMRPMKFDENKGRHAQMDGMTGATAQHHDTEDQKDGKRKKQGKKSSKKQKK